MKARLAGDVNPALLLGSDAFTKLPFRANPPASRTFKYGLN